MAVVLGAKLLLAALLIAVGQGRSTAAALDLVYTVSFTKPATHLYEVEFDIGNLREPSIDLQIPVWTPGSYLIREYARNIQDFEALDESGRPLRWTKKDKATWHVETTALATSAKRIRARYRVYANELTVRTSHLDSTHAYFNPASLLMYVKGETDKPSRLKINAPQGWKVTSPLALTPDASGYFHAPNYDILVDSPHEVGTHRLLEFQVLGKPHRIAIWGDTNVDTKRLTNDVTKMVEQAAAIFGGLPYEHYTFIAHLQPNIGGGLEHLNSTTVQSNGSRLNTSRGYVGYLGLLSHEYFHLWNIKRIRPQTLGPFDYQKENYTQSLWFAEGVTDYYSGLLLRRAQLMTPAEYLERLASTIQSFESSPGRFEQSAESSSFDAWIKYYRPDENSVNSSFSYYTRGALLGWVLDLELRSRTNGAKSLDDVMRYLFENYAKKGVGFPDADLEKAFSKVAGSDFADFFAKYVRGTTDIDFENYLNRVGLQLRRAYAPAAEGGGRRGERADSEERAAENENRTPPGWLGVRTNAQGDRVMITNVVSGSAGYEAGLNSGDEIVAVDGTKVTNTSLPERLSTIKQGDRITLTLFRREKLMTITFSVDRKPFDRYSIVTMKDATPAQTALRNAWLADDGRAMTARPGGN